MAIKHFVVLGTYSQGIVVPWTEPGEVFQHPKLKLFDSRADATTQASQTPFGSNYGFNVYTTETED